MKIHCKKFRNWERKQRAESKCLPVIFSCILLLAAPSLADRDRQVPYHHAETQHGASAHSVSSVEDSTFNALELLEPIPLAVNGDSGNRVDLVYFGDGYTIKERDQFLEDAQSLTDTLLVSGGAFAAVRNLLNFWAVFIPSEESGIGTHGVPKNTTFGLYRPGEELRAVFYSHPDRVMAACKALNTRRSKSHPGKGSSKRYGCDEPILLANDKFYGGLGGTPTVITASPNNGVQVLRHELGHTLIPVGEEYDGGYAYSGVNAAIWEPNKTQQTVPWNHWLSDLKARHSGRVGVEDSRVAVQAYPWFDLSNSTYTISFKGGEDSYPTALLRFSVSGVPSESYLDVALDDELVNYTLSEDHRGSLDRTWVQVPLDKGLAGTSRSERLQLNNHTLVFTAKVASPTIRPMLSSAEVIEYGPRDRFNKTDGHIGAYRTVDIDGDVTLRPTNEGCLMRDVTVPTFCSVCLEGLTLSLLGRVSLVESSNISCPGLGNTVQAGPTRNKPERDRFATISLRLLEMANASYAIHWTKADEEPLHEFTNRTSLHVPLGRWPTGSTSASWYTARVKLSLPHVRVENHEATEEQVRVWFDGCT